MSTKHVHHFASVGCAVKQAAEAPYGGYNGFALQSYLPVQKARKFSPEEEAEIEEAQRKILPRIFESEADPVHADMASTLTAGTLPGALAGAAVGGGLGGLLDGMRGGDNATLLGLGLLLGGAAGGGTGYMLRKRKNETIRDRMRRLPPGATRRDMLSDPLVQRELDRRMMMRMHQGGYGRAGLAGGLAGALMNNM